MAVDSVFTLPYATVDAVSGVPNLVRLVDGGVLGGERSRFDDDILCIIPRKSRAGHKNYIESHQHKRII